MMAHEFILVVHTGSIEESTPPFVYVGVGYLKVIII